MHSWCFLWFFALYFILSSLIPAVTYTNRSLFDPKKNRFPFSRCFCQFHSGQMHFHPIKSPNRWAFVCDPNIIITLPIMCVWICFLFISFSWNYRFFPSSFASNKKNASNQFLLIALKKGILPNARS